MAFSGDVAVNWRRALDGGGVPSEIAIDTWDGETILFDEDLVRLGLVTSMTIRSSAGCVSSGT